MKYLATILGVVMIICSSCSSDKTPTSIDQSADTASNTHGGTIQSDTDTNTGVFVAKHKLTESGTY